MKRISKIAAAVLCLLMLMLPTVSLAAGNPEVNYTGQVNTFEFNNVSYGSPTDLFVNFKNVMPGDSLEQKIDVKNTSGKEVKIYMRMDPVKPEDEAFLSELYMTVKSYAGTVDLYEAPPSEQDGLKENVLLGTFMPGASLTLDTALEVPADLGNEFAFASGDVVWVFTVEEMDSPSPTPTDKPSTPKTGDDANIIMWIVCAIAACIAIAVMLVLKKKIKQSK